MSQVINLKEVRQRKGKREENKRHLEWIKLQGCCICGKWPVEAHHLLHGDDVVRGMGRRADDKDAVPLCPTHHRNLHAGPKSFEIKYGEVMKAKAEQIWGASPHNPANKKDPAD